MGATIIFTHPDLVAPVFDFETCRAGIVQVSCNDSPSVKVLAFPRISKRNALQVIWKSELLPESKKITGVTGHPASQTFPGMISLMHQADSAPRHGPHW